MTSKDDLHSHGERKPSSALKIYEPGGGEVAAAVSLLEFCANVEDYAPTVRILIVLTIGKYTYGKMPG